jgi:hypothetical protein
MAYIEKTGGSTDRTMALINKGDKIEGFYLGSKDVDSDYGVAKLHIFQTQEERVGIWGKTYLDTLLTSDLLGLQCLVEMTGIIPPKKKADALPMGIKFSLIKIRKWTFHTCRFLLLR